MSIQVSTGTYYATFATYISMDTGGALAAISIYANNALVNGTTITQAYCRS